MYYPIMFLQNINDSIEGKTDENKWILIETRNFFLIVTKAETSIVIKYKSLFSTKISPDIAEYFTRGTQFFDDSDKYFCRPN